MNLWIGRFVRTANAARVRIEIIARCVVVTVAVVNPISPPHTTYATNIVRLQTINPLDRKEFFSWILTNFLTELPESSAILMSGKSDELLIRTWTDNLGQLNSATCKEPLKEPQKKNCADRESF